MSPEIAIQVEGLAKCYRMYGQPRDRLLQMFWRGTRRFYEEFWALRDVSFDIARGETVGIVGRNGSGKSTLLQMICGTVTPTRGAVRTQGRVAALLELGAGFNGEFTGRENALLNAAILGIPESEMAARMDEVLAFSELGSFLDQPVKTYSSGMYSRLAFSIAIHVDPDILIIDEALSVGDARFVAKCMRRIKDIQQAGATVLFVSHDVASVRALCERVVWLDAGRLQEIGDVFPVTSRYMEFMFQEEAPFGEALQQEAVPMPPPQPSAVADADGVAPGRRLEQQPVAHWGSHTGLIRSAVVRNAQGQRSDVVAWGDPMEIAIDLCIPASISRESLSVAFSIKDLKGTDLLVSTTHDFERRALPEDEHIRVAFRLTNPLVTGNYLLVAAVENRHYRDIHYYEYVEGAHYFASLSEQRLFGIFHPAITQSVSVA